MNAGRVPDDERHRQAFFDSLVSGDAASPAGCAWASPCTHGTPTPRPGLALHISQAALQAGQLQRVLERRFDQAVVFDGCYIYLDAQGALVIWHALPAELQAVDQVLSRMLSLGRPRRLGWFRQPLISAAPAPATRGFHAWPHRRGRARYGRSTPPRARSRAECPPPVLPRTACGPNHTH